MSIAYTIIEDSFKKKRRDLSFEIELLDQLSTEERQKIEEKIVKLCLNGDSSCFKYISSLKFFNPEDVFTEKSMTKFSSYKKATVLKIMYEKTKNNDYLNQLLALAKRDISVYTMLVFMCDDNQIAEENKSSVIKELGFIAKNSSEPSYDNIYEKIIEKSHQKFSPKSLEETIKGGLFGFATADALGVPIEFTSRYARKERPLTEMVGFGSHNVPEGTWSDDTSMTIATMDAIASCQGILNYELIMRNYCDWARNAKYTATDRLFDIGNGTKDALMRYYKYNMDPVKCGGTDERNNGNGSLMRMLPLVYYLRSKDLEESEKVEIINCYSSLTHGHEISKLGCKIYYDFMDQLLDGKSKEEAYFSLKDNNYSEYYGQDSISKYNRILEGKIIDAKESEISSSGYVVSTLEACLWSVLHTNSYEDAVVTAINLGDDTDTVGAITGSMAGTIYGLENIPKRWISRLRKKELLGDICDKFTQSIKNPYRLPARFDEVYPYVDESEASQLNEMMRSDILSFNDVDHIKNIK